MSVAESVRAGERRAALESVAVLLGEALDGAADPRELEGLSRELRIVLRELEGLADGVSSDSRGDALAARRKAKQAANG